MLSQYKHQECINLILVELKQNSYFLNFTDSELKKYLNKIDNSCCWVKHYENNSLAGFIAYYCNDLIHKKAFITLVLVASNYRGLNIAKKMLNKVLFDIQARGFNSCALEVKIDNLIAIKVYQSLGFKKISTIKSDKILNMKIYF